MRNVLSTAFWLAVIPLALAISFGLSCGLFIGSCNTTLDAFNQHPIVKRK